MNRAAIVVIGRNEGERLKRCLQSLPADTTCMYVDSGSMDGSAEYAIIINPLIARIKAPTDLHNIRMSSRKVV